MEKDQSLTECSLIIEPKFSSVLKSISQPELKCKGGNAIDHICTNKKCKKVSFHCSGKQCECYQAHQFCHRNWFDGFTTLIKNKENFQRAFFEKLYETDNQIIDKVQKSNQDMATQISMGSFEDKYMQILNKIYYKKEWENFFGAEMEELYLKLTEENHLNQEREAELQKIYSTKALLLIEEGISFKKEIFNSFLKNSLLKEPQAEFKPFIDSPLIRTCLTTMYANTPQCYKNKKTFGFCYFQSEDADRKAFEAQYIGFLQKELYNAKTAELIFTASEHQFKAAEFHKKCDGVENTLTVIRTQFGKTIFAFVTPKWTSASAYANDTTNRSCIILLDLKKKCSVTSPTQANYGHANYGPTFGGGHDIHICNDCNTSNGSYCNFPYGYNNGYTNGQVAFTTICGAPSGYNFKVIEYEVFKLTL